MFPSNALGQIFLNDTLIVNLLSAILAFAIGVVILFSSPKKQVNQLGFLTAGFLSFWAFSSTLTDIFLDVNLSLFWARMALAGALYFGAFILMFSMVFPESSRKLRFWPALLILLPSLVASPFVQTGWNVVSVTKREWGTDFEPGILLYIGFVYAILYLTLSAANFIRVRQRLIEKVQREQVDLVSVAIALVILAIVTANVVLPGVFNYTKASMLNAIPSLVFVSLMGYAIFAKGAMSTKVVVAELCSYILMFATLVQVATADSVRTLVINTGIFVTVVFSSVLLIRSIRREEKRREELQVITLQLRSANDHLKEMDRLKSEFISIASHQLRTPISVIKGYFSLMLEGAYGSIDGPLREKIESMYGMNERLVEMVNNMLNVSRIERNKIEYACGRTDIAPIIRSVATEMAHKAQQKGMTVYADVTEGRKIEAFVDPVKLQEVIGNLVDNAIKYSPKGTVTVTAAPRPRRKEVVVTVADQGIGMTPDAAAHMFQKFYRANDPAVTREAGTGLGLYICAVYVRGMGGEIWIERTVPGQGTVVAFSLPTEDGVQCMPRQRKP